MPKYSDGTEAAEGDLAVGTLPDASYRVVGTVHSIGEGTGGCNAQIRTLFGTVGTGSGRTCYRMAGSNVINLRNFRRILGPNE